MSLFNVPICCRYLVYVMLGVLCGSGAAFTCMAQFVTGGGSDL